MPLIGNQKGIDLQSNIKVGVNTYNITDTLLVRSIKKARREKLRSLPKDMNT
jgi:hypothetical protein